MANDTAQKCQEIVLAIVDRCNKAPHHQMEHECISFQRDFGGMSLTVFLPEAHHHVGAADGSFADLVDRLHDALKDPHHG